ncbi:MAG: hypothetical protein ABI462_09290 [Ignavibacteria bacterium]
MANKYFIKDIGLLRASGKDTIDFINRMSTNNFKTLPADEFRKTVFTTDKGRIIDLVNVVNLKDNLFLLTSDNFQDKVKAHLDKYIIMDDVMLERPGEDFSQIIITGDDLEGISKKLFDVDVLKNKVYKLNENVFLFYDDHGLETLNIILNKKNIDVYADQLKDLKKSDRDEYESVRIEAGIPEGENELNDQINPVECGLGQYVSFTKGCYIGQEVIARLDSQGKIPKQMVKLKSESMIGRGDKIYSDEKETGFVSSVVKHNGNYTGLGFIRSVNLDFEKNYFAEHESERSKIDIYKIN